MKYTHTRACVCTRA